MKKYFIVLVIFFLVCIANPQNVSAILSNDPLVSQWAFEKTKVFDAWDIETGSKDVVVAVIDNGFDYLHPDIRDNVWKNTDEIPNNNKDDDRNGYVDDVWGWNFVIEDINKDGVISKREGKGNNDPRPDTIGEYMDIPRAPIHHGTVVAGLIGAVGNNELYGSGVAWRVRLMNIKVASNGGTGSLSDISQAILYAVNNGADIINLSLVGYSYPEKLIETLRYAKEKGVLVIAAAGNNGYDLAELPAYPICTDGKKDEQLVLGVNSVGSDRILARFSNIGGDCIDITAPGISISSTMRFSPTNGFEEGYGGGWNGTSFAAPIVSGAAALIKSVDKSLSGVDIRRILLSSTSKTPTTDEILYKSLFGAGFLDVVHAVQLAKSEKEKRVKNHEKVVVISKSGSIYEYVDGDYLLSTSSVYLENIDDVASYGTGSSTIFVTTKWSDGFVRVSIFDNDWNRLRSFSRNVPVTQNIDLFDADYDGVVDIVLSPGVIGDNVLFRQYDLKGRLQRVVEPQHGELLGGVGVFVSRVDDRNVFSVAYKTNEGSFIDVMNENGAWVDSKKIVVLGDIVDLLVHYVSSTPQFTVVSSHKNRTDFVSYSSEGLRVGYTGVLSSVSSVGLSYVDNKPVFHMLSGTNNTLRLFGALDLKRDRFLEKKYKMKTDFIPQNMLFL